MSGLSADIAAMARRIEAAQAHRLGCAVRARAVLEPERAGEVVALAPGVTANWDGPDSLMSRVVAVGFTSGQSDADIHEAAAAVMAFHRQRGPARVDLCPYADARWTTALSALGFRVTGFKQTFGRGLDDLRQKPESQRLTVQRATTEADFDAFATTLASAIVDGGEPLPAHHFGRVRYQQGATAFVLRGPGGEPAGGATLSIHEGVAELFGTAVVPRFRRQGGQALLLRTRLSAAAEAGAELATVSAVPDSASERNLLRAGFRPLYTQVLLAAASDGPAAHP